MPEFVAALVAFTLAGLALGLSLMLGRRRAHAGCHHRHEPGPHKGCGRPDCCSAERPAGEETLATIEDRRQ